MEGEVTSHPEFGKEKYNLNKSYTGCLLIPNATVAISFTFIEFDIGDRSNRLQDCLSSTEDLGDHEVDMLKVYNGKIELFTCSNSYLNKSENLTWGPFKIESPADRITFDLTTTVTGNDENAGYQLSYTCKSFKY